MGAEQRRKASRRREREMKRLREVRAAAAERAMEVQRLREVRAGVVGRDGRGDGTGAGRAGTPDIGAMPEAAAQRPASPRRTLPWAAGPWPRPGGDPIAEYIGSVSDREDALMLLVPIDDLKNVREIVHMAIGRRSNDEWMLVVLRDFTEGRQGSAYIRGHLWSASAAKEAAESLYTDWGLPFPTASTAATLNASAAEDPDIDPEENLIAEHAGPAGLAYRDEVRMVVEPEEGSGEAIRMIVGRHADGTWMLLILRFGKGPIQVYRQFPSADAAWGVGEEVCAGLGRVTFRCGRTPAPSDTTAAQAPS